MKKILWLIFPLALLACQQESPEQTDLYLFLDYTEGQDYGQRFEAELDQIISLMQVDPKHNGNYGQVRIIPVHDIGSTPSKTVKLKAGKTGLESNPYVRKKEVDEFKQQLAQHIDHFNAQYQGQPLKASHIYYPLCKGINKLNRSAAQRKLVVIYSDMLENSEIANLHRSKWSSKNLNERLNEACSLEDLSDIEVHVVYPVSKQNDQKIRKAADFWEQYLVNRGLDGEHFHFETGLDI